MNQDQNKLLTLITKRHPEYDSRLHHWEFMFECYEGGRDWFQKHIFKYLKEGDIEYKERIKRAYRFNHSKEVVDLVNKYIFKSKITRSFDNAPNCVLEFWEKTSKNGKLSIDKFIRKIARDSSIYGRIWIVVDNNRVEDIDGDGDDDRGEYAYIVKPQHVLDMSYDDDGELNWILIAETFRENSDPFSSDDSIKARYRLWTRNEWFLIEQSTKDAGYVSTATPSSIVSISPDLIASGVAKVADNTGVTLIDSGTHGLGIVPVFAHDHNDSEDELYSSPSLIADIAYLDRACANYLSNLDAIIQDQSFSQLAMPAQGIMPGEDSYNKLIEMGTKRIFLYDGEGGSQPFFLSPDPRQAELIITAISKIINEIYHTVGMAGERTKQDNSVGIDNSSGVAKAYDFERVNALLTTKAAALKVAEVKMMSLVMQWNGIAGTTAKESELAKLVNYPDTFDVRGLSDEFSIAQSLILVESPIEMLRQQLKVIVEKLYPTLDGDDKEKMFKAIEAMPDLAQIQQMGGSINGGDNQDVSFPTGNMKGNRQGENNTGK